MTALHQPVHQLEGFGRTLLPLGRPFGFIRKGPLTPAAKVVHVIEPIAAAAKG